MFLQGLSLSGKDDPVGDFRIHAQIHDLRRIPRNEYRNCIPFKFPKDLSQIDITFTFLFTILIDRCDELPFNIAESVCIW